MTDKERLEKLEAAVRLIREVEFSYEWRSLERGRLYRFVAQHCSFLGVLGQVIQELKQKTSPFLSER